VMPAIIAVLFVVFPRLVSNRVQGVRGEAC
jgi:hypothetical protein